MTALVVGLGNVYRRDDGVGRVVAERLRGRAPPAVEVVQASGEATALMERWRGRHRVYLIDAVRSAAAGGTVHRIEAHRDALPGGLFQGSSHAFGLVQAVELGRTLHELPRQLVVYGVEGVDYAAGTGLSTVVEAAAERLVERLLAELTRETNRCTNSRC